MKDKPACEARACLRTRTQTEEAFRLTPRSVQRSVFASEPRSVSSAVVFPSRLVSPRSSSRLRVLTPLRPHSWGQVDMDGQLSETTSCFVHIKAGAELGPSEVDSVHRHYVSSGSEGSGSSRDTFCFRTARKTFIRTEKRGTTLHFMVLLQLHFISFSF